MVFLDIETGPLPKEQRLFERPDPRTFSYGNATKEETRQKKFDEAVRAWESGENAALKAETGRVLLIGMCQNEYRYFCGEDEKQMLDSFWNTVREPEPVVGHNSLSFDIPFLIRRSLITGATVPPWVLTDIQSYNPDLLHDTMRIWQFGDRRYYTSLDTLCAVLGFPVYDGPVTGAKFWQWWEKDRAEALCYNEFDVRNTEAVYHKLGGKR
jgi:hypothetical protein